MPEILDATTSLESTTVGVYRTAATVKGGRRFSFSALVVVGDRQGRVGIGYGKANQVPQAIEKAQKFAKRKMHEFPMVGRTIPHTVTGRFGACLVRLVPASPGTGVIAGAAVRAPLEMMGVQDCLSKAYGSTNAKNLVKAVINGLGQLRSKELVQSLRNVDLGLTEVEESIQRGRAFMPAATTGERAVAPVNVVGQERSGGRGGRGGRGGGGGRRGGGRPGGPGGAGGQGRPGRGRVAEQPAEGATDSGGSAEPG
jgi:small subunit ribosomal protein S5